MNLNPWGGELYRVTNLARFELVRGRQELVRVSPTGQVTDLEEPRHPIYRFGFVVGYQKV